MTNIQNLSWELERKTQLVGSGHRLE